MALTYHIRVFITKARTFRARVTSPVSVPIEFTVGGDRWTAGEFKKYEKEVLKKCSRLIEAVNAEAHRIGIGGDG